MGVFVKDDCVKMEDGSWLCCDEKGKLYVFTGKEVAPDNVNGKYIAELLKIKLAAKGEGVN